MNTTSGYLRCAENFGRHVEHAVACDARRGGKGYALRGRPCNVRQGRVEIRHLDRSALGRVTEELRRLRRRCCHEDGRPVGRDCVAQRRRIRAAGGRERNSRSDVSDVDTLRRAAQRKAIQRIGRAIGDRDDQALGIGRPDGIADRPIDRCRQRRACAARRRRNVQPRQADLRVAVAVGIGDVLAVG